MARTRQIYQTDLLYVGPTGANPATGKAFAAGTWGSFATQTGNANLNAELYRVQRADYNWAKTLTDVNQFGELAAIDRVPLEQPTVGLTFSYLQNNLVNEKLIGLDVASVGSTTDVSCISGVLSSVTDTKNFYIKTVAEGQDAADNAATSYSVIALGNGFLTSYTAQGAVGGFPTVDVGVEALNMQGDSVTSSGVAIPAVNPTDGTAITGWCYTLPTGVTSYNNAALTSTQGVSVLRPGDINLDLGITDGDTLFKWNDLKLQNYNLSLNMNRENLNKLGSKYAYAKVIQFPIQATMTVSAVVGDLETGNLIHIVNNNKDFNPTVTITQPGTPSQTMVQYKLKGAKLDSNEMSSSIGANKTLNMTFTTQIGGPQDLTHGLFMSGVTA